MRWIGGKKKRKKENASSAIENQLLKESTYCYFALSPIRQTNALRGQRTPTFTKALRDRNMHKVAWAPMSEQMTEALITVMARWKRRQNLRQRGEDRRKMEVLNGDRRLSSCPVCQMWQQTERGDNCFVRSVIAITFLPPVNKAHAPFTTCHSFNLVTLRVATSQTFSFSSIHKRKKEWKNKWATTTREFTLAMFYIQCIKDTSCHLLTLIYTKTILYHVS